MYHWLETDFDKEAEERAFRSRRRDPSRQKRNPKHSHGPCVLIQEKRYGTKSWTKKKYDWSSVCFIFRQFCHLLNDMHASKHTHSSTLVTQTKWRGRKG
mmetsp:Transcript_41400/g.81649  ORF Transcript_41400/g.81649 Transcript_41400/m.81649 type:complete len:99 (+) Transcript_41400:216-512(+)